MRQILLIGISVAVGLTSARPQNIQDSISSVLQSLATEEKPSTQYYRRHHPQIITKYDFIQTRNQKSSLPELPPEFTVSTDLHVSHDKPSNDQDGYRSGRSHGLFGKSRRAKQGFSNLASAVRDAPVIVGRRVPDDETDAVVHRGGRFINNMYVPDPSQGSQDSASELVPREVVVTAEFGPAGVARSGRSYESLDQEYSPSEYTFSPLQHFESQQRQGGGAAVFPADNEDFVIEMQTYQQCPECPVFSVPVPIPKFPVAEERQPEKSLLAKLADIVRPVVKRAKDFLRGDQPSVDRVTSRVDSYNEQQANKISGPIMASLAAVGLGIASYFSNGAAGTGRGFEDNTEHILNTIDNELETMSQYSVDDVLCLPRQYCDNLLNSKHLLDEYPNMKTIAAWMTEKYFENIEQDAFSHSQCNVRQCLKDLLH